MVHVVLGMEGDPGVPGAPLQEPAAAGHGDRPPRPHRRPRAPPYGGGDDPAIGREEPDGPFIFAESEAGLTHRRVPTRPGLPGGRDEARRLETERAERSESAIDPHARRGPVQCPELTAGVPFPVQDDLRAPDARSRSHRTNPG